MEVGGLSRQIRLIRHASPTPVPGIDPGEWVLGDAGVAAALALRPRVGLLPGRRVLASHEPKAVQTARAACGVEPIIDARFGEVRRPVEPYDASGHAVRARRGAWVTGALDERHAGWETPAQAAERFAAGVDDHGGDLVIGTHGMVLTAWLVSIGWVEPGVPARAMWEQLGFPDVVDVVL